MNVHGFIGPSRILGILCLIAAALPVAIGVWFVCGTSDFYDTAVRTEGTVVELKPDDDGDLYHSVYEYADASGRTHRGVSSWASNPPSHAVGDRVEVFYDPGSPSVSKIEAGWGFWLAVIVCAALSAPPLVLGLVFLVVVPMIIRRVWPKEPQGAERTARQGREESGG